MTKAPLPRVLCVDDDARLLEGLTPHLRRDYDFHTAPGGEQALKLLAELGGAAVIVSDMRMPVMDGAVFLGRVAQKYPTATRILLTGEPGRDGAIRAVNEGQIYRFLTKPCPPQDLKAAINAGVRQHELMTAERVLLQETLLGSIKALIDVLGIIQPTAFGRAGRLKRLALELAADVERKDFWQLEAAALLSQVGFISLPTELVEKFYSGAKLTPAEKTAVDEVPQTAKRLLGSIPRLEPVLQILDHVNLPTTQLTKLPEEISLGARILALVLDYDTFVTQGNSDKEALENLKARGVRYDPKLLEALARRIGTELTSEEVREIPLHEVRVGMTLLNDVRTEKGVLLVPHGFEVSLSFLERMRNFSPAMLEERVKVLIKPTKTE